MSARPFRDAARSLLLALVRAEPDPIERAAMLATMRAHGHLPPAQPADRPGRWAA